MRPSRPFRINPKRGYSLCIGCENWRHSNNIFYHENRHWVLCLICWCDYWENTDVLLPDFKDYKI